MLSRLEDSVRTMRSRRHRDERGSAMLLVMTVVLVGFLISAGISAASLASINQTTKGRSQVQALAAAEAGRDTVAGYLKKPVPTCGAADMSGTMPGSTGSWSVKMYYRVGANQLPTGYDAAGVPQGAGWSGSALCIDMASADFDPGLYTVVLSSTGTAPDGTQRLISAVYPFRVEKPGESIVAPTVGPFTLKGALGGDVGKIAHEGDVVVTRPAGATGPTFTCGTGSEITVIKGSVYVLDGDAEFRWPGCFITGDLYVAGNLRVTGGVAGVLPGQPAFEKNVFPTEPKIFGYGDNGLAQGRLLWVGGNVRAKGNVNEENGMTVRGHILAGGNVTLRCGLTKGLGEVNVGADLPADRTAILSGGKVSLLNNAVNDCGGSSDLIKGHVKAVTAVEMGSSDRGLGQAAWKITGDVRAGTTAAISGSDVSGTVTAPQSVSTVDSDTGPVTAGTTATLTGSSAGMVKANGAVSVSNSSARDVAVSEVTTVGPITVARSGIGAGSLTISGDVMTGAGDVTITRSGTLGGDLFLGGNVTTGSGSAFIKRAGSDAGNLYMKGVSANGAVTITREDGIGGRLRFDGAIKAHGAVAIHRSGGAGGNLEIVGSVSTDLGAVTITRAGLGAADLLMQGDIAANGPVTITRQDGVGQLSLTGAVRAMGNVEITRRGDVAGNLYVTGDVTAQPGNVTITREGLLGGGVAMSGVVRAKGDVTLRGGDLNVGGVEATGNVTQDDSTVMGCVRANGSYAGTPKSGTQGVLVGKCIHTGGPVTLSAGIQLSLDGLTFEAAVGNDTVSPAIWSGTSVRLNSLGGTGIANYGVVSSNVQAPSISVAGVWNVKGSRTVSTATPQPVADPSVTLGSIPVPTVVPTSPPVAPLPSVPTAPTAAQLTTLADGVTVLDAGHWMDLSHSAIRDAALSSGYQTTFNGKPLTFSGSDCHNADLWNIDLGFGLGLGYSKAGQALGQVLKSGPAAGPAPKYLIDATACADPFVMQFNVAVAHNSDVVVLVKNFKNHLTSTFFGGTSGTAASPRNLFIIQPDSTPDHKPTCNNGTDSHPSDRNKNKRPDEQSGRNGFDFDSSYGTNAVSTMFYTPCGFGGVLTPSAASSRFYGQLFLGRQSSGLWNEFHCQPMQLGNPVAFNLTCGEPMTASGVAGSGGSKAYTLESDLPLHQTEPS